MNFTEVSGFLLKSISVYKLWKLPLIVYQQITDMDVMGYRREADSYVSATLLHHL